MDESSESPVTYVVGNAVATITLNRPNALNSFNVAMKDALLAALITAHDDPDVRAVVLTGAGRGFCAGQDLREHADTIGDAGAELSTVRRHFNPIVTAVADLPKPVIAAVNGTAAGAGAALAFACDFRLASDDATFLMAFARVGLGADTGASWTLQRLVGYGRAMAMMMLAEPVTAPAALEMGLVNAIVPSPELSTTAAELAGRLAAGPTFAYTAIKQALMTASASDLQTALELEADLQEKCGATRDHVEAVRAFVAKQQPVFTGR